MLYARILCLSSHYRRGPRMRSPPVILILSTSDRLLPELLSYFRRASRLSIRSLGLMALHGRNCYAFIDNIIAHAYATAADAGLDYL